MKRYRFGGGEVDSINMAQVLMLLSQGGGGVVEESDYFAQSSSGRVFECKTCNRQFPSFQALGGHRASHKKPRPAGEDGGQGQGGAAKRRVHECSICGLEFAIGQALGGHMRRHRAAGGGFGHGPGEKKPGDLRVRGALLDLNLPPLENDLKLGLGLEIVLDKIPMVGCLH